jgi:hypothetical protein
LPSLLLSAEFGICRIAQEENTSPSHQAHTPALHIPEQHCALVVHEAPRGRQVAA